MSDRRPGKSLEGFLAEAQEVVDAFGRGLLGLPGGGQPADPDLVNALFRSAHSLKGLAALFSLARLAALGHALEDLLDGLRMGRVQMADPIEGILLDAVDVFNALIADGGQGLAGGSERSSKQADALEARILAALSRPIEASRAPPEAADSKAPADPLDDLDLEPSVRGVLTEYEEHRLRENARARRDLYRVRAAFDLSSFDRDLSELSGRLKAVGEVLSTLPAPGIGAGDKIAFDFVFGTERGRSELEKAIDGTGAELLPIARKGAASATGDFGRPPPPAAAPAAVASPPGEGESAERLRHLVQTVRVDIHKLDRLMNVVGELVLAKSNLMAAAEALKAERIPAELSAQIFRETRNLERRLDELQAGILDVRMVPLAQVFDKLARMLRKVSREANKEVDLRVSGGDVELDKLIVEELSDPLMHLIRNAVDHGIEAQELREQRGKSRRGTLTLGAYQKGNHVVVELSDDGGGIDRHRVLEVALERGLLGEAEARSLTRRELVNLIFLPGFSTARAVSSLSGRGVGLDVVKNNIANLSGIIDVESEEGKGTVMRITLPITLAILQALIVEAAKRTYAIPLNSVLEIATARESDIRTIEGREVLSLRDQTLPLIRLAKLFRLREAPRGARDRSYVVVVGLAQERVGIVVDGLAGEQDVVIKPLGGVLGAVRGIAGATDLGHRRTVLVLDIGAILEESAQGGAPDGDDGVTAGKRGDSLGATRVAG